MTVTELRDITCHRPMGSQCSLRPDTSERPRLNPSM